MAEKTTKRNFDALSLCFFTGLEGAKLRQSHCLSITMLNLFLHEDFP